MLTSYSSNAIYTKARAIYGKRIKNTDYSNLSKLHSVSEVCAYLKNNTAYANYLKGANESAIHRGQLENLLKRSLIEKYFGLLHYDFDYQKGFYRYVIANAEINLILSAIILINAGSTENMIVSIPSFLQEYIRIDFNALARVKTWDELLTVLQETPYKNIIKHYYSDTGVISFKDCELALRTYYYKYILGAIEKQYKGKLKTQLMNIIKIEIDITNLSLMFRLKNYFERPEGEIKMQLLPFKYKLSEKFQDDLLATPDSEGFIERMHLSSYSSKMRDVSYNFIEDYTKRLLHILSKKAMRFTSDAPVAFFSLMTLMQIEIDNLIVIIEGVRYELDPEEIQKLLILE